MLDAEEARARLAAVANPRWAEDAARRTRLLLPGARNAAKVMLDVYREGRHWTRDDAPRVAAAGEAIDRLDDKRRLKLMTALHPPLGRALSGWWVASRGDPYQAGWMRRAFRAPRLPHFTAKERAFALGALLQAVGPYPGDAAWLAAWAPFLKQGTPHLAGPVLAAAIDAGDEAVYDTLVAVGSGTHPVGVMDRHVVAGLLRCARADAWEFVERLLLAAQRQEGLRQVILEAADEAHPMAFDRMLALIAEHDLLRFAATVRAVGVWLGMPADVEKIPRLRERLALLRTLRADSAACKAAVTSGDPEAAYLALCAIAMHDVEPALVNTLWLADQPDPHARAVAARFAHTAALPLGTEVLVRLLDDPDLDVAVLAHALLAGQSPGADALPALERLAERLPESSRAGRALGVETEPVEQSRTAVVGTIARLADPASADRILRWLPAMDADARSMFVHRVSGARRLTPALRRALVTLVGDRSSYVRRGAVEVLSGLGVTPEEAQEVEALLTRRAGDLRRAVIGLLANQQPAAALASAERLWGAGDQPRRDAACELLRTIEDRSADVVATARRFVAQSPTDTQRELLGDVTGDGGPAAGDPWHGVYEPALRAPVPAPRRPPRGRSFAGDEARRAVSYVDDVAHEHRDTQVTVRSWQGTQEMLLADLRYQFSSPFQVRRDDDDAAGGGLVLGDVFRAAWAARPAECRAAGPLDALRAYAVAVLPTTGEREGPFRRVRIDWFTDVVAGVTGAGPGELRHPHLVRNVLSWLAVEEATAATVDECLDAVEAVFATLPLGELAPRPDLPEWQQPDRRHLLRTIPWLDVLGAVANHHPELVGDAHVLRWFRLVRWFDEAVVGGPRVHPDRSLLLRAYRAGAATDHDLVDALLEPRTRLLADYTRRHRAALVAKDPELVALADRVRDRAVEVERARGDLPTPATPVAHALASVSGVALAVDLLAGLGRSALVRGWAGGDGREETFSGLLRVSYPGDGETGADLAAAAKARRLGDKRLIELAVFAPQWGALVEEALGWPGFEDAVWWFHAHTKDEQWRVPQEVRDSWTARSAERTALSAGDLVAGAVDVAWFARAHATLGDERWAAVHDAAKLASAGSGHKRAQLFADAMLGRIDEETLLARIAEKRHQDAVRALGLLPLPAGDAARQEAALARFRVLREYERQAAQFGSMRQANERLAVRVGVDNLARTAGYPDPQRFVWAMEAAEAGDLADGPVVVTRDDVTVTLSVSADGVPELTARRGAKTLGAVPAALRKVPEVAALRDRKAALTKQAPRVRRSLEDAMVRQEALTEDDLAALDRHPIVAPMLAQLVFVDAGGRTVRRTPEGFADARGRAVRVGGELRVAHPVDLLDSGEWVRWQETLFAGERRQPFKQVFRELYVLTPGELAEGPATERYAGHQLQPRQALALFGNRGWLGDRESGELSKAFHAHGFVARVRFLDGFLTPLEVELPTLGEVFFTRRGEWLAQPLDAVPRVVFSEAMRDLDLVVSVAHAGGVDPETSSSTVEMRAALVRETARLMRLGNVEVAGSHAVVQGSLGEYSIHLGSGVVHRRPGGALCIIPVDSQRRGRVFLPFADDDPRTAEVVAKVLLLAKDTQIKDPTILEQLRS